MATDDLIQQSPWYQTLGPLSCMMDLEKEVGEGPIVVMMIGTSQSGIE